MLACQGARGSTAGWAAVPLALCCLALPVPRAAAQGPEDGRRCEELAEGAPGAAALAHARTVIAAEPEGALAAFYRGCVAAGAPQGADRAAEHFARAVRLNEGSGAAHDWLARAYAARAERAGRIVRARLAPRIRSHLERAVALDPDNADARAYLAQLYLRAPALLGGSEAKGWEQIGELRRRHPYRGGMLAGRARAERRDRAGAIREYETVLAQFPDSSAPLTAAAVLLAEAGQPERAFALVDRFRARHPAHRGALYAVGRLSAVSGLRLDDGRAALERYLTLGPPAPGEPSLASARYRLGMVLERRGDRAAAIAEYEAALRLDPTLADARKALAALRRA